jgi:hypothetical protein
MRTVTVNFIGVVAPGLPRQMVLSLDEEATIRSLIEELSKRGGEGLRRAIWAEDGRVGESLLIAVDGEVVDPDRLDRRLTSSGDPAEVSLFLSRPIFGG